MIARGDLAVEVGFERLAELQEEILWLCEAAHVPVIWATQVLETLAKAGGRPVPRSATRRWAPRRVRHAQQGPRVVSTVEFLAERPRADGRAP